MTDFFALTAQLSADALSDCARELLAELEETGVSERVAPKTETETAKIAVSPGETRAAAAEALLRRLSAGETDGESGTAGASGQTAEAAGEASARRNDGTAETGTRRAGITVRTATDAAGTAQNLAETADIRQTDREDEAERLSERVRRDARRYDPGFTRY